MSLTVFFNIGSATEPHLACFNGLQSYASKHELHWDIRLGAIPPETPTDSIIITSHPSNIPDGADTRYPVGTLFGRHSSRSRPCLAFDEETFGTLAARHLFERGYRHACIFETPAKLSPSHQARIEGFRQRCEGLGIALSTYRHAHPDQDADLVAWLLGMEHSIGVYAATDNQAAWLRQQLLEHHGRFPRNLALIGTGNHIDRCMARRPALTSVSYPWSLMGGAIAHWIHRLIQGQGEPQPQTVRPHQVITRATTPMAHIDDEFVNKAVKWLQRHLHTAQPLHEAAKAVGCSPETLCRRFKKTLGISPQKMHSRFKLDQATRLLNSTILPMAEIAKRSGFSSPTIFSYAFKKYFKCSPTVWKKSITDS